MVIEEYSRFPEVAVVKSTNAISTIARLDEIFSRNGVPSILKSDNGPPFNSREMDAFAEKRNIELVKIAPGHPAANNVETVMKPLGKAMKIGVKNMASETDT